MSLQCHKNSDEQKLIALVGPLCELHGYELVDLQWHYDQRLVLFVDKAGGVSVEDCSALSEIVSRFLDVEDPIQSRYTLEVSSPGLERPLRTLDHFRHLIGQSVKIKLLKTRPLLIPGKVPQFNIAGKLRTVDEDGTLIVDQEAGESRMLICDIDRAHRMVDWEKEYA